MNINTHTFTPLCMCVTVAVLPTRLYLGRPPIWQPILVGLFYTSASNHLRKQHHWQSNKELTVCRHSSPLVYRQSDMLCRERCSTYPLCKHTGYSVISDLMQPTPKLTAKRGYDREEIYFFCNLGPANLTQLFHV